MTLSRAKIGMVLIALMALMAFPVSAYCSADWMNRPGTIGHALSLKDGTSVYLDAVVVDKIKARQNPAYVLIRECFDSKSRIVILTQPLYELSLGQTIDVEGTMITLADGQRAIVDPIIKGYLDRDGNLLLHGPLIKGLLEPTPWQWKTDMSERSGPPSDDSSPSLPGEPSVSSSTGPRYYSSIANILRLDHSVSDGFLVHLQCKPVVAIGTDPIYGGYFVIGEDHSRETLKVYCREPASVGDRINKISGQLHYEGSTPVLCVDAGPDYDHQVYVGRADVISNGRSVESGEIRVLTDDPPTGSIAYAKTFADTESVTITGKVVSATRTDFPNAIYVQEPDRAGGIRVLFGGSLSHEPVRGDTISVTGTIGTGADIEREIDADTITYVDHPGEPNPLGMPNRILGGSDFNIYTPGVNWPDGSGVGLYNKGLLVKIWGRVTSVDTTNKCFYVDDGTGFDDGSDHIGVKVSWDWPTSGKPSIMPPLADWYVSVTGISGSEDFGSQRTIRVLRPRDQNDVVIYQAGTPIVYDPVDAWQEDFSPSDSSDGGGGSSSADSVDLATGAYNNDPDADIVAVNQVGPDAEFTRLYRSKLAQSGSWSAGLAVGWTHNYDVKVVRDEAGWGDLKLVFPDGAADTLRPVVVGGTPTDAFTPMGPSYLVTGEHSGTPGLWNWIRITFPDETKWEFTSASGSPYRLRKISDIEGNSIYVNRNVDTSISSISTDSSGTSKLLDFSYSSGNLTISDVPSSKSITLSSVTEAGATVLKSVTQVGSSNLKWRYAYESIGSVAYLGQVEAPDPTGEFTYRGHPIYYDSEGRVREIKDANDNSRTYAYGQGYTQVYAKNASGVVEECWAQKIGTNKEDLGEIDANGKETTIEYNTAKRPWRFTNKNSKQSSATYDDYGNVTQVTDEAGVVTTYGYNDSGSPFRLTSVLTTAGSSSKTSTTFQYYSSGLLQYVNSPKPGTSNTGERVTTEYIYKSSGNVWKIITPPGLGTNGDQATWTIYEYESDTDYSYTTTEKLGQPIVISVYEGDPTSGKLLSRTHLRYDSRGRLTDVIDPLIGSPPDPADYRDRHKVTLAYNDEDQITDIWYAPTGSNVNNRVHRVYAYDHPGGELTSVTLYDEASSEFRTVETLPGKVAELKEVLGDILHTNQAYDSLYRLKEVKDFNNHATSFGYDGVGNVSSMRYAGTQTYQRRYDADHNQSKRIDALTRTTNYGYDTTKSYLTSIDYPTGTDVSIDYDDFGRVESVADATGVVSYTYDDNDLVMTVTTDYAAGSAPSKTITYVYNQDGSRRSMAVDGVSAGAFVYSYAYNASPGPGLMVTVSNPGIGTPVRCYYNLNGQIIRQTAPRLLTDYTYDNRGLRASVYNWATLPSPDVAGSRFYDMQYDAAGNLLQASITIPQVDSSNARSGVVYYEYDDNDRLTRERRTISGGSDLYDVYFDYDGADNATQVRDLYFSSYNSNNQINATGYDYDANGNATDYRGFGFDYDYEDLPNEITGGRNGTFSPAFRSDGLRAWRYTSTWGYDCFLYDGDRVVAEFNAEDGSTNWYYNYGPNGLAMRSSAPSTYYVYSFDHLGSLVQTFYSGTSSPGLAQRTVIYDAFGKLWWDKTSGGSTFTTPDPPGFAGQWGAYTDHETRPSDQNTPLVLMGVRYYDPITARFVTRDPALGINDYAYCGNNPVGRADADGEILETIADIASIGWSTYDLIKNPSWANAGYLAWDVGATVVPFVPGSYVAKGAKIASKAVHAVHGAKVAKAASKAGKVVKRVVRNPFGKKGGILHQKRVEQIVEDIRRRGLKAETEFGIRTPGARNGKRYADVVATHPKKPGVPLEIHQVGRTNKYGYPVRRETEALHDIRHAKDRQGASMHYHPYDK